MFGLSWAWSNNRYIRSLVHENPSDSSFLCTALKLVYIASSPISFELSDNLKGGEPGNCHDSTDKSLGGSILVIV